MSFKNASRDAMEPVCISISSPITNNPSLNDKDTMKFDTNPSVDIVDKVKENPEVNILI